MGSLDFDAEKTAFRDFYDSNRDGLQGALGSFKTLIEALLLSKSISAISSIDGRIKDREECISKFTRKYRTMLESNGTPYTILEKITDLIGLRVVCLYEDDVERVKDVISEEFNVLDVTDKISQVESTEDSFGYKGLHLDLRLNEAREKMAEYRVYAIHPFELQIRTVVQDSWSIIDHKIKYKRSIPNSLKRRINTLAALFELADREFRAIREATETELERAEKTYPEIEDETEAAADYDEGRSEDQNDNQPSRRYAPLDAFNFLRIAKHFFPEFVFEPHKVDGFTQEIVSLEPNISRGKFNFYMREKISDIKRYQAHFEATGDYTMNPFTIIRHCLYAGDQQLFAHMLTETARERFDTWLQKSHS
ncbi:(p)ppGpp synthetase [Labrenzia sp. OB1]|uniref:GTP pyrophosphokinase n=1 Tax=Labrenzia sp. OB1 TaxID=1561204 RepID=UPI0007B29A0D|nr:(p)ppGpp synthetase [Labrenzia sp. OB1]KZM41078.1 (p)ppGpp synthetase [Labrenzia sp. OB1]